MSDINELFSRDPMKLTRETDIPEIIKYYKEKSQQFQLGDKQAGATKKMKKEVNLDDILDII